MAAPSLTHKLQVVQRLLDHGVTVTIAGNEYIQAHALFLRGRQQNGDGSFDARPLLAGHGRLGMINLVSKMSEEEFFTAASTSALNDSFKGRKSVIEMIHDAIHVFNENKDKIVYINEYIDANDTVVTLDKPISIALKNESTDLPFSLVIPEVYEFGKNITEIDTRYAFSQTRQSDPQLPPDARIYGSMHKSDGEIIQPKFTIKKNNNPSFEP
ncbi:MAG: hypothetical protein RSG77_17880 [Hafnia sp.]